jgi:MOSC domain-containing protein YiiM
MSTKETDSAEPIVVAVCISDGGVPKLPQATARVTEHGLEGDGRGHAKHNKPSRALSLVDEEVLDQLRREGYDIQPGSIGENITLRGVHVQQMQPGTVLQLGEVTIRLEEPRKPCFILDVIDEKLKDDILGRCGYMASVLQGGELKPGARVEAMHGSPDDGKPGPG